MRAVKEKLLVPYAPTGAEAGTVEKLRSYPARTRQFFHDVRLEMRNVTWPTWNDVQATTLVVLVATVFFGFYLGMALDVPLAWVMDWFLKVGRGLVH
ncbi:MAG: preprotein translocase subunit SecE [Acidobacteria bacterium]|nr:preprotein translocase subunit SecE [Acidobacteriota bacterium]